jgi:hypothetical protein
MKIKRKDSFAADRPLQDFGMAQRSSGIPIAGFPMLPHAEPRKLIVLGMALIGLRAIDQVNDVVDRTIGRAAKQLRFRTRLQVPRQFFEQAGKGSLRIELSFSLIYAMNSATKQVLRNPHEGLIAYADIPCAPTDVCFWPKAHVLAFQLRVSEIVCHGSQELIRTSSHALQGEQVCARTSSACQYWRTCAMGS